MRPEVLLERWRAACRELRSARTRARALERALSDMVEEFGGYRADDAEDFREPKALQRARALLRRPAR